MLDRDVAFARREADVGRGHVVLEVDEMLGALADRSGRRHRIDDADRAGADLARRGQGPRLLLGGEAGVGRGRLAGVVAVEEAVASGRSRRRRRRRSASPARGRRGRRRRSPDRNRSRLSIAKTNGSRGPSRPTWRSRRRRSGAPGRRPHRPTASAASPSRISAGGGPWWRRWRGRAARRCAAPPCARRRGAATARAAGRRPRRHRRPPLRHQGHRGRRCHCW